MNRSTRLPPFLILGFILGGSNLLGSGCALPQSQDFSYSSERSSTIIIDDESEPATPEEEEAFDEGEEESWAEPEEDRDAAEEPSPSKPASARKLSPPKDTLSSTTSGPSDPFETADALPPSRAVQFRIDG